jgi:putative zinc finger/helix-turn-helix YgiT family protein
MSDFCTRCGAQGLSECTVPHEVEHEGKTRSILDTRTVCAVCGAVSYIGAQISRHELAVSAAIREMDGLLSAEELRRIRAKYRLKQTDLERMCSIGPKTWTRWERGKVVQSKSTDTLIRLLADDPEIARRLMQQAGVVNAEADAVFRQIEEDAQKVARAMIRVELGKYDPCNAEQAVHDIADMAFKNVSDVRREAAARAEAA